MVKKTTKPASPKSKKIPAGATKESKLTKQTETTAIHPMEALLKGKTTALIKKNQRLDAKIISISKKRVLFDIGAKAYAVLGDRELKEISSYMPYLRAEEKVIVRIISEESKEGFPVVSMRDFFNTGKWDILNQKKENEEEIDVIAGDYGKGGVFIEFMGIRGVIPKIQLTEDFINSPEKLKGQRIKVKVLEVNRAKNRLVVSQKASVLKISQKNLQAKFDKIKEGDIYKAKVLGTSEFGIFCDVEGVEGLIHISEISWEKVTDATQYAKVGDVIDVFVVEKNPKDIKLNLSIKRLSHDPWKDIETKYPKDRETEGTVVRREKYGYFVRLEPGVEGLIHISKLSGHEDLKVGQKINVFVERVNNKERRMSLVLPQKEKPVTYR